MKMTQENLVNAVIKELVGEIPLSQITKEMTSINIHDCEESRFGLNLKSLGLVNLYALMKKYNLDKEYMPVRMLHILPKNTIKFTIEKESDLIDKVYVETLNVYEPKRIFKSIGCNKNIKIKKPWKLDVIELSDIIIKTEPKCMYIYKLFGLNLLTNCQSMDFKINVAPYYEYVFRITMDYEMTETKLIEEIVDEFMKHKVYTKSFKNMIIKTGSSELDKIVTEKVKENLRDRVASLSEGL